MKKLLLLLIITNTILGVAAQNVPDKQKAALKNKRFEQALSRSRESDSVWFYSQITESYIVNGKDTLDWVLNTPRLIPQATFKTVFDSSTTIHISKSSEITMGSVDESYQRSPRHKKHKTKGRLIRYIPFVKMIGMYSDKRMITQDFIDDTLPVNIKKDNVWYMLIRADNVSIWQIFSKIKFTNYVY